MTPIPKLSKPATRALAAAGVASLEDLARLTREEFLALHGVGPSAIPPVLDAMKKAGLSFAGE
ncbi:hypothetical protein [Pelagibacterium xiamenense]|uniref:hypothetical protein n=1 Tax=Pelagibacterium xiamenense TaxID=2901140 RepID=UPI001E43CB06|nr:hypothetical protein [Pelagibacterium xiamenense]MCD7059774.1 hypothetical protein [Pelagibacterium xiamenense]